MKRYGFICFVFLCIILMGSMRSNTEVPQVNTSNQKEFEVEVKEFAHDVFEALCDIWDRLKALEKKVGI